MHPLLIKRRRDRFTTEEYREVARFHESAQELLKYAVRILDSILNENMYWHGKIEILDFTLSCLTYSNLVMDEF